MVTLKSNIPQFLNALEKAVAIETYEATFRIINDSQRECPVDTGKLISSWYGDKIDHGYEVGYSADYAAKVDYHTGFFRDAAIDNERIFLDKTKNAINKTIRGLSQFGPT